VRARNNVSYLTVRRFSAQDRVNAIRATKRLKADAGGHETSLAAAGEGGSGKSAPEARGIEWPRVPAAVVSRRE
jgi:hypothetical protein